MDPLKRTKQNDWFSLFLNPPDVVAVIIILLALIQAGMGLAPDAIARNIWRVVELSPTDALRAVEQGEYFRGIAIPFLGHIFFHINLTHLLLNIVAIGVVGSFVFHEMETASPKVRKSDASAAFAAYFFASGMFAGLFFVLMNFDSSRAVLGASGAGAGLFGGAVWILLMRPSEGRRQHSDLRKALTLVLVSLVIVALSIVLDTSKLSILLFKTASAWQAHVGGYLFGLIAYPFFERLGAAGALKR